jgi:hypothetical protein
MRMIIFMPAQQTTTIVAVVAAAAFSPATTRYVSFTTTKAGAAAALRPDQKSPASFNSMEATILGALRLNDDNNNNNNDDAKLTDIINKQQRQRQQWKQRLAHKNFGGRASRGRREGTPSIISKNAPEKNDTSRRGSNGLLRLVAPLVGLTLVLRLLFGGGGGGSSSNFYYYQNSSFESRVVTGDGKVDTARKESIRSNIPGLIIEKSNGDDGRRAPSSSSSIRLLEESAPSADFDDTLDREIESILRQERRMMDDFFY